MRHESKIKGSTKPLEEWMSSHLSNRKGNKGWIDGDHGFSKKCKNSCPKIELVHGLLTWRALRHKNDSHDYSLNMSLNCCDVFWLQYLIVPMRETSFRIVPSRCGESLDTFDPNKPFVPWALGFVRIKLTLPSRNISPSEIKRTRG